MCETQLRVYLISFGVCTSRQANRHSYERDNASHRGKPTKLYDNALFQMYDNGDEVKEMTPVDHSDWDASSDEE